jgi:DNA-binding transcriptional ArsR family regulator
MRISDVETLRVLADPLRVRIIEAFGQHGDEPVAVKEIARTLGEPLTKLYYHVNLLEQHGLVVVASSRLVSGIVEKRYRPAAQRFELDKSILVGGEARVHEALKSVVASVFDATVAEIDDAVLAGRARLVDDESDDETAVGEAIVLSKGLDRLTRAEAVAFRERLRALYEEFGAHSGAKARPGAGEPGERHPFGLVLAFYPMAEPEPKPKRQLRARTKKGGAS